MGIVMRAFDPTLQRTVAVKVLNPVLATACDARERFLREARTAAAIQNEHVVIIHAVDTHQSVPYLVMEYVAGESLQEWINANHRFENSGGSRGSVGCGFDFADLCRISAEIAAGLSAAHADGVIRVQIHESLATAVEGAANGDVIEVFGDGPYLISPIKLHEKPLTIRAARGAAPLFLHDPHGQPGVDPFLQTDSNLQLEGLGFHWNTPADTRSGTQDESLPRGALPATRGRLRILNCRIVVGGRNQLCQGRVC